MRSWESILADIDAKRDLNFKIVKGPVKILKDKLKKGEKITLSEFKELSSDWKSKKPFLDEQNKPFVLYIYDRPIWYSNNYKYHFTECSTLIRMENAGRFNRYKQKYDLVNKMFDRSGSSEREMLSVCCYCFKNFPFEGKAPSLKDFNINEFYNEYLEHKSIIKKIPNRQYSTGKYSTNWSNVSVNYKNNINWKCEKCKKNMFDCKNFLHTHHKNGVKDDNRTSNLIALCKDCHSKEPYHSHMKGL